MKVICPTCNGDCYFVSMVSVNDRWTCEDCGGTGEVTIEEEEVDEQEGKSGSQCSGS